MNKANTVSFLYRRCPNCILPSTKIVLEFNYSSTIVGHFVSSHRERVKREKEIVEEMKIGTGVENGK